MNAAKHYLWGCFCLALLAGCSPKRIDPPTYRESSPVAAQVAANLHAREIGGQSWGVADTHSMEPLIFGGDFVVSKPAAFESLQLGQVIIYQAEWAPKGPPVCHRLVQRDGYGWIMAGDNVRPDIAPNGVNTHTEARARVTEKNYIGLVVGIWTARPPRL